MKKPIRFTTIGAFIISAIGILVVGIIFLGSGEFFKSSKDYVMFFDQSVNGLSIGAPLKFRGVEVGTVKSIGLSGSLQNEHPQIAVRVAIHNENKESFGPAFDLSDAHQLQKLVNDGLKAQLMSQSILSGDLYVSLDIFPEIEPRFVLPKDAGLIEIPTVRSGLMEEFTAKSANLSQSLTDALENLQRLLANIDQKLGPVADESVTTMRQFKTTLNSVNDFLDPNSPFGYQLPKSLAEIERAAKSIRLLAEYLERNPSSVLFGRSKIEILEKN